MSPTVPSHRHTTDLQGLIGNTPLVEIRVARGGRRQRVFAKYEALNFTGSVKDRMAWHILCEARRRGELRPGDRIVEATSGNTGIAFAALGVATGHPVTIYMPDWMSAERVALIRSFGAEVVPVSAARGGFRGAVAMAEDAARQPGVFLPRQFENADNAAAHELGTGREILDQMGRLGLNIDAFVAGVGTGGTVMGVGRALRAAHSGLRVHPLEPASSPTLTTGHKVGSHRIQGISDEFVPAVLDLGWLDEVVAVDDGDAILMAQQLARRLGLAVGISSGANVLGALGLLDELGDDAVVVTVLPDSNKKYLSTDLCREEPVEDRYLTPDLELLGLSVTPRCC